MKHEFDNLLISWSQPGFKSKLEQVHLDIMRAAAFSANDSRLIQVRSIFCDVLTRGDQAISEYTEKFDGVRLRPEQFRVSETELKVAHQGVDRNVLSSLRRAIDNVRGYQSMVFVGGKSNSSRSSGIKYTPIKKVGVCVPGASAPLPSTVIMTVVPAQVAGVEKIVVVSPPRHQGSIHPVILAVCHELGIDEVYRVGGVQAVAALAFESDNISIPKVYKIVGPGNQWVQAAKREAFGYVDIDSIAGPSEVLIIANDQANPAWVAADMLSQAEHGPGSGIVFTDSEGVAAAILKELKAQVERLNRREETYRCLLDFSGIFVYRDMEQIIGAANDFASEHLQVQCGDQSRQIADQIDNAGAIFIGEYSPVAVGDYWAGPSHTLPTGMSAKFFSPLSANDFVKSTSIIEYSAEQLAASAEDIIRLAQVEGLDAHARSIRIRQQG